MRPFVTCLVLLAVAQPASTAKSQSNDVCGLLVMAHGGTPEWNAAVDEAVAPLRSDQPTSIAFGMADPETLAASVAELEGAGVACIAVVRLFVSGTSFLHHTEYLLGQRADAPAFVMHHGGHGMSAEVASPAPISTDRTIVIGREGLLDDPSLGALLARRAAALSTRPEDESVLVIAHGPGDDSENEVWIRQLDSMADSVRAAGAFHAVEVHTLREDWKEKRAESEARIRAFVSAETAAGRRVLVIPFRLFGFGPYAKVLDGLTYVADERGLLPDPAITAWIRRQADVLMQELALLPGRP